MLVKGTVFPAPPGATKMLLIGSFGTRSLYEDCLRICSCNSTGLIVGAALDCLKHYTLYLFLFKANNLISIYVLPLKWGE